MVSFSFIHGLGDTVNVCQMLKLWLNRGYDVEVACYPDKEILFKAIGCKVIKGTNNLHPWTHPDKPGTPNFLDGYSGNKTAWNLVKWPLPNIGSWSELWPELCESFIELSINEEIKWNIEKLIENLPKPLILLHTKGDTQVGNKNFNDQLEKETAIELMDLSYGTVILLDWDNRSVKLNSMRFRNSGRDFKKLSIEELYWLITRAELFVGIDSGPLHLARMTKTPVVGVWFGHHPAHFAIPYKESIHLVSPTNNYASWNRYRRHEYNIVETELTAKNIARWSMERLYAKNGLEVVIKSLLEKCRFINPYIDRHKSFDLFFNQLPEGARVVETGSIRADDDWSAGFFTYLCGLILLIKKGQLNTLEINSTKADFARKWTTALPVNVYTTDSVEWLEKDTEAIDGIYLDSLDIYQKGYAEHCLKEVEACFSRLKSLVLIDDTYFDGKSWKGKGELAVPWLVDKGWEILYSGHQTLLRR